jgi:hypothetical protein
MKLFRFLRHTHLFIILLVIALLMHSLVTSFQDRSTPLLTTESSFRSFSTLYEPFDNSLCKDEGVESSETTREEDLIRQRLYQEETIRADSLTPRFLFDEIVDEVGEGGDSLHLGECRPGLQPQVSIDESPTAYGNLIIYSIVTFL